MELPCGSCWHPKARLGRASAHPAARLSITVLVSDNSGWTALDEAAYNGEVEVIKALVEAGAEVDHADNSGWTALHVAAQESHVEIIQALLHAGADLNLAVNDGDTPLAIARANNHEAAVLALVQAGATE